MKKWMALAASFLCGAAASPLACVAVSGPVARPLPATVVNEIPSPSGRQAAVILRGHESDRLTFFPLSDERFYLAIRRGHTMCIVDRELSDGFGGYEGGIGPISWQGDDTISIQRWVSDQQANLAFNTTDWTWSDKAAEQGDEADEAR